MNIEELSTTIQSWAIERPIDLMIVDDDELIVLAVSRVLRDRKLIRNVTIAHDGIEALALLDSGEVKLERLIVLVDLQMPRMGGIELLEQIRSRPTLKSVPVIILTNSREEADRQRAYGSCVGGYFFKPSTMVEFEALLNALQNYWTRVEFA